MITTVQEPNLFSPVGNPIIFKFSSDDADFVYFKVAIKEAVSGSIIYEGQSFPTPKDPTLTTLNLSKALASVVKYKVDNDLGSIALNKTQPIISYEVTITEMGIVSGFFAALDTPTVTDTFYAFDGQLDILNFNNFYTNLSHVVQAGNTAKFLTIQNKPKKVNAYSTEQLYFLQEGYTSLNAVYNIGGTNHTFPVDGISIPHYTYNPEVLASKAVGSVTITSSGAVGDNIGVYANGVLLGSYTIPSTGLSTTAIASSLSSSLIANGLGYTISYAGGSVIYISAPSTGTAGNSIVLTTALINASTTTTTVTSSTLATTSVTGYAFQSSGSYTTIIVEDPDYGYIVLAVYPVTPSDSNLSVYTTQLVANINSNSYGYTATKTGTGTFTLTARTGTGANMNGKSWSYENDISGEYLTGTFSGGVTTTSGSTTTYHTLIPNSLVSFAGGTNYSSASTTTTYTTELGNMIRLQTSPKAILANGVTHTFTEGEKYTVLLKDPSNINVLTEPVEYVYSKLGCHLEAVNILWVNPLGGIDSYTFIQPQESVTVTRLDILKNNLRDGSYINGDVYNVANEIYSSFAKSSIKVYTQELTDKETAWFIQMVNSKQCWIELSNNTLMPVTLVTTNYNVQRTKYLSNQINQYSFEFAFAENTLPGTAEGVTIKIN